MEPPAAVTAVSAVIGTFATSRNRAANAQERLAEEIAGFRAEVRAVLASGAPPGPVAAALTAIANALTWDADAMLAESESGPALAAEALAAVLRLAPLPPYPGMPKLSVVAGG